MAHQLTRKHFEEPEKGQSKQILEISRNCFRKICNMYKDGVNGWGYAVNNPCTVYDHKTQSDLHIEEHSYNNTGMNARFYLVVK